MRQKGDDPTVSDRDLEAVDLELRRLRDEPVEADVMARMREGLRQRIADAENAPVVDFAAHRRARIRPVLWALATAAAAVLAFQLWPAAPGGEAPEPLGPGSQLADGVLESASDEEVAIALSYETLADLEVIEQLEVLELLDALDTNGAI